MKLDLVPTKIFKTMQLLPWRYKLVIFLKRITCFFHVSSFIVSLRWSCFKISTISRALALVPYVEYDFRLGLRPYDACVDMLLLLLDRFLTRDLLGTLPLASDPEPLRLRGKRLYIKLAGTCESGAIFVDRRGCCIRVRACM